MPETLLGFDYGSKKIGVACGQSLTGTANPLTALASRDGVPDWPAIEKLVQEWQPSGFVVGLPLNMDDSESESSSRARRFARQLHGRFSKPVWMVDERLSTREARDQLGSRNKRGPDPRVDSLAAVLMIESYFRDGGITPQEQS
ncbi:MAG: Holliday junction resolvase RuvX [Alcanivoracaceae bacterium]|nr:Holliday junction resolvase RuvX [Alcanivoracaceae bacterium]